MKNVTFKENPYIAVDNEQIQLPKKLVYECIKRISDIVCSLIALIILSPVMLITMIAIYIDDPGSVIFKQVRIGKDGKEFMIYKFRSMKINAEELKEELIDHNQSEGANFKMRHDPRRTRVGKFIRKASIDELPQLVNILKGDMSIIGPRPFIPEEQSLLPGDRLLVKPGLSCYWQIGGKNTLSIQEQIALDRKYVAERSFMVDLKIIIKTFFVIFNKDNK
ncbi:MAG: sugar transferase [Ruminococcus flavefaciens]|nr:sugar transferase [Ruminococcus flavefaciens]MCM1362131.1 sugar transferase [Clostridiales bacterium]MCM1435422.1 sugar transferase [Ruminococcus flavefaciens]